MLCLDLFWTKRSGSPSELSTLKNITCFPHCWGNTHISADTKPCKVLISRPPFSSFRETTILFALSLPFCVTPFWQELTQRGHEGSNLTSAVFSDTCAVCKGGGGGVCYGRSISAQASFTRGSELPLSKWRQRAHKDNRTLVSSRKPVFCLLQTCSCAPRAQCSEALKKGPYHRGLKTTKKVHLLNAQTVLSSLVSVLFWLV